jgi:hypothetical protein
MGKSKKLLLRKRIHARVVGSTRFLSRVAGASA